MPNDLLTTEINYLQKRFDNAKKIDASDLLQVLVEINKELQGLKLDLAKHIADKKMHEC